MKEKTSFIFILPHDELVCTTWANNAIESITLVSTKTLRKFEAIANDIVEPVPVIKEIFYRHHLKLKIKESDRDALLAILIKPVIVIIGKDGQHDLYGLFQGLVRVGINFNNELILKTPEGMTEPNLPATMYSPNNIEAALDCLC